MIKCKYCGLPHGILAGACKAEKEAKARNQLSLTIRLRFRGEILTQENVLFNVALI